MPEISPRTYAGNTHMLKYGQRFGDKGTTEENRGRQENVSSRNLPNVWLAWPTAGVVTSPTVKVNSESCPNYPFWSCHVLLTTATADTKCQELLKWWPKYNVFWFILETISLHVIFKLNANERFVIRGGVWLFIRRNVIRIGIQVCFLSNSYVFLKLYWLVIIISRGCLGVGASCWAGGGLGFCKQTGWYLWSTITGLFMNYAGNCCYFEFRNKCYKLHKKTKQIPIDLYVGAKYVSQDLDTYGFRSAHVIVLASFPVKF